MAQLVSRKTANEKINFIFDRFHYNLMSITDSGIENSQKRDYFWSQANKVDQGRFAKDYLPTLNSLDAVGFKKYYKLIGEFATQYKIPGWKDFNNYEPLLIEELTDELARHENTEEKLDLINSFTVEELKSEEFIFASKVQLLYDIIDDCRVLDDKERGINKILESFNSNNKSAFIAKIQSDRRFLDALIDKVNGTQKDEMFAIMGEFFISSGFIKDQKVEALNNLQHDNVSAKYSKGKVFIEVTRPVAGGRRDYSNTVVKRLSKSPFDIIGMNYDGREIRVPALLLLNSWSNSAATPEGIFFNYKYENVDWNKLNDEDKDEYFKEFVKHYMGEALFNELIGNPAGMIFATIVGLLLTHLFAIPAAVIAIVGAGLAGANIYAGSQMLISALEVKKNARNMHEYKKAAKLFAESIAKIGVNVLWLIISLIQTGKAIYKGKEIKVGENNRKKISVASEKQTMANNVAKEYNAKYKPFEKAKNKGYKNIIETQNGGVSFSESEYIYMKNDKPVIIDIEATGTRNSDFATANKAFGFARTPEGYTWHHLDNYNVDTNTITMELVQKKVHSSLRPHSGGCAQYDEIHGPSYNKYNVGDN